LIKRSHELLVCFLLSMNLLLASCSFVGETAEPVRPPAAPQKAQVQVNGDGLQVFWRSVPGATHYTVFWGTETGQYRSMGDSATNSAFITDVVMGELYYVTVTSWNARGESNYSPEVAIVYDTTPARADIYLGKGNDAMKRGLTSQAHAYFCAAIRLDPQNVEAYRSRAALYEMINLNDLAGKDLETAENLRKNRTVSTKVSSK
jgi:hypothetical protein